MTQAFGWLGSLPFERLLATLLHFFWQGAAIAAACAGANLLIRRNRPELRYAVSCAALLAMLAAAVATFATWTPESGAAPWREPGSAVAHVGSDSQPASRPAQPAPRGSASNLASGLRSLTPWIVPAWVLGVLALSTRLLYGWRRAGLLVRRSTRAVSPALALRLGRLAARLAVTRPVRLLESASVRVPMAIGTLRPVVLLPLGISVGLTPEQLEAILAHELAHIRRHDYFVNLLQSATETLLFYHPAVWWVSRQIRQERENCCDDLAIGATGSARTYARALVGLEQMRGALAGTAQAASGGGLWQRVARLFPEARQASDRTPAWAAGLLAVAAVGALGAVAQLTPELEPTAPPASSAPSAALVPPVPPRPPAPVAPPRGLRPLQSSTDPLPPTATAAPGVPEAPDPPAEAPQRAGRLLTPEQLIAFRQHGVTPEFVREVAAQGFDPISPDDLIAMKIHGVTLEFLQTMTKTFGRQPLDTYVSFRIHGVTPEFVAAFRGAGYASLSPDDALAVRIHGVSLSDAAAWTALGFERPSLEDLVALRVQGVDADYARAMRAAGFATADLDDLVAMKIHGVTPEFAESFRALGYTLSADDATSFRIHGVDPKMADAFRALGYDFEPDDLVALRVHGVTPEFAQRQNQKLGERLPLDDLIELRRTTP